MGSQLRLSPYVTLTNYGPLSVKFIKKRGSTVRPIYIPRQLVDLSLAVRAGFDTINQKGDEKVLVTQPEWRLSISHFTNGKKYMCYTKTDATGSCVKWGSMNLTEDEFEAMGNGLTGYNGDWIDTVDGLPSTMEAYYGVIEEAASGIQRVCTERYVDRHTCELESYKCVEPGKRQRAVIKTVTIEKPTAQALLKDVYHYCIQTEFRNMVKKNCYGCQNDRGSQIEHMDNGCLSDEDVLIENYGGSCHKAISALEIAKAVDRLCRVFKVENTLSTEYIAEFYSGVDYNELISKDKAFFHEFHTIWG